MEDRRKKVLVVDSDDKLLTALERLLEEESIEATTTWSAEEALRLLCSNEFDVLLMGDELPELSCEQLLREAQRSGVRSAVLVMQSTTPRVPSIASYFISLGATGTVRRWNLTETLERVKILPTLNGRRAASVG